VVPLVEATDTGGRAVSHMVSREQIEGVLDRVRPYLRAEGGDIELVAVDGPNARVRLTGLCASCPTAALTLRLGVERALRAAIGGFGELEVL